MTREIEVDLSIITCQRISDLLTEIKKADLIAAQAAWGSLPMDWRKVIRARDEWHLSLASIARLIGCTIDQVRHRQMQGLLALCKAFEQKSGITVKVKCYRDQR